MMEYIYIYDCIYKYTYMISYSQSDITDMSLICPGIY